MTGISAVDFDEAARGCVTVSLGSVPVRIIGREALLENKRSSGRTKDLAGAEEIEKVDPG